MAADAKRVALTVGLTLVAVAVLAGAFFAGRASKSSSASSPTTSSSTPASTSAPATPTSAPELNSAPDLLGTTDPDPSHWAASGFEKPQRFQVRLFDAKPTLVKDFPVTMNGCDTRQLRVAWR